MDYRLSPRAEADLDSILEFIHQRNPPAAVRLLDRFEKRWELLATQPRSGPARDDLGPGLRQLTVGSYITIYRVEEDAVLILRVLHGKRRIEDEPFA